MRYLIVAALAATSLASPAMAVDKSWYVGLEGGVMWPQDESVHASGFGDIVDVNYKTGIDVDGIVGYDFGWLRLEGEVGYKHARHDNYDIPQIFYPGSTLGQEVPGSINQVVNPINVDADGSTRVWSGMLNALLDANLTERLAIYGGGGVGYHSTRIRIDFGDGPLTLKDNGFAWQVIAGARYAVSDNVDIGLKYRYFRTDRLNDSDVSSRFASHSVLASLIYNFASPPPHHRRRRPLRRRRHHHHRRRRRARMDR